MYVNMYNKDPDDLLTIQDAVTPLFRSNNIQDFVIG